MKYEFDTMEEVMEAFKHLDEYHDCEKCHGKIVCINVDKLGNTFCGYCNTRVEYPRLKVNENAIKKVLFDTSKGSKAVWRML